MRNVTTPQDDRLNEVADWFFNQITELMHNSPYNELADAVDTAGYIKSLLSHAAFASLAVPFRATGRENQVLRASGEMAMDLFGKLNELMAHYVGTQSTTNDIERN